MEASIFVSGMFHLPLVCEAVAHSGFEAVIHSSYPGLKLKDRLPESCVINSYPKKEIIGRFPEIFFRDKPLSLSRLFQHDTKNAVDSLESDIAVGWAGHSLGLVNTCNKKGIPVILERGSTHISWQRDCLLKAYDAAGVQPNLKMIPSQAYIENELLEYERASIIHVPSELCAKTFEHFSDNNIRKKLRITRYGFNIPSFETNQQNCSTGVPIRIGFAGTLSVRKGFFDYCWLANNTDQRLAEFAAIGNHDADTKTILKLYRPPFTPKPSLPKPALFETLSNWDILILPSYEEGLSMVIPEAMSQNTIVIGSDVSGATEYIRHGKNGFIFEHGNRQQLKDLLHEIIHKPELIVDIKQQLKENNHTSVNKMQYLDQFANSIQQLLGSRR
jgi:glycosyltransferase involved in cell wall biosynthesis